MSQQEINAARTELENARELVASKKAQQEVYDRQMALWEKQCADAGVEPTIEAVEAMILTMEQALTAKRSELAAATGQLGSVLKQARGQASG